ncbi:extensin family protein [Qipengyuania sphaerica]|uniref:extensin-like domain-containing protein n=1 Tax=Qipengyuania sphaerica TaxID=2867243 RepID=UPI001C86D5B3|nr:extensin family protein [Qipengyuania sphaerica]MBX7540376.1 extensin family protein [Qipengyuania sphaerica]
MKLTLSRHIGKFIFDRRIVILLIIAGLLVGGRSWLAEHPQHDPWAALDLNDPKGWATQRKLLALRDDVPACRAVLTRSNVAFAVLDPVGEGECRRDDRTQLGAYPLSPDTPATTCPVAIAMELWKRDTLNPLAQEIFGSKITRIEHLGAYSCRRMYGSEDGPWSEHATANALDITGFMMADGTRISVLNDWKGEGPRARFLHQARDGACGAFSTVLSPDYNAAHADHLHFDMDGRWISVCR